MAAASSISRSFKKEREYYFDKIRFFQSCAEAQVTIMCVVRYFVLQYVFVVVEATKEVKEPLGIRVTFYRTM